MSRNGIDGGTLSPDLPYAAPVLSACGVADFFPSLAYAIFWRETISGEVAGMWTAATVVSPDGGHGLGQLTSLPIPPKWQDPYANALWAIDNFLKPAESFWKTFEQGDDLVRCIAAEYNAGRGQAIKGHEEGNVDAYTTDNYAAAVLGFYTSIVNAGKPT